MYLVEIAFGHRRSDGQLLPVLQVAAAEQQGPLAFSQFFQGGRVQHCTGSSLTAGGQTIVEPCTVVRAYASEVESYLEQLQALASEIAKALE